MSDSRKFVIFDLDGTLIDSYECAAECVNSALAQIGYTTFSKKHLIDCGEIGKLLAETKNLVKDDYGKFKACFDSFQSKRLVQDVKLIGPTISLLSKTMASNPGVLLIILTNKEQKLAHSIFWSSIAPNIGQPKKHQVIIYGRRFGEEGIKKDIQYIEGLLNNKRLKREDCLYYCGDSVEDEILASLLRINKFIFSPTGMARQSVVADRTELEKGLDYIFTILRYIQDKSKILPFSAPKLIYRGITQRVFTSSPALSDAVTNKKLAKQILIDLGYESEDDNRPIRPLNEKPDNLKSWYKLISDSVRTRINSNVGNYVSLRDNYKFLKSLVEDSKYYFSYLSPSYLRSGAAVRLNDQMTSHRHVDYLWYLRNLISEVKRLYPDYDKTTNDLDVLAEIQHMGGATCLVDFSRNVLVSLWFATQDYNVTDTEKQETGYLLCYDVNYDSIIKDNLKIINNVEKEQQSIENILLSTRKSIKYNGDDSYKFVLWTPSNINNRIIRQDSIFLFGIEPFRLKDHNVVVIPIPFAWKKSIQMTLKTYFGISSISLYGDKSGYATSNNKFTSLSINSSYFCEDGNWPVGIGPSNVKNYELFQIGTGCLIRGEYEHALDYMHSFIACNSKIFANNSDIKLFNSSYGIAQSILYIESVYSKALCFRHLDKKEFAVACYKDALQRCTDLYNWTKKNSVRTDSEGCGNSYSDITTYLDDKRYKILDSYIGLLLDLNYHKVAYEVVEDLISEQKENAESTTKIFLYTVQNEIIALAKLWKNNDVCNTYNIRGTNNVGANNAIPYCTLLNKLFSCIIGLCDETEESKYYDYAGELRKCAENIKAHPTTIVSDDLDNISFTGNSNKQSFCEWDLSDINKGIIDFCTRKPKKKKCLMEMLSIVDDVQRFMEGTRTVIRY